MNLKEAKSSQSQLHQFPNKIVQL